MNFLQKKSSKGSALKLNEMNNQQKNCKNQLLKKRKVY